MTLGRTLVLVGLAALALRAVVATLTPLGPDGAVELAVARAFAEGRPGDGLDLHFHPLFATLVALLARLLGVDPAGPGLEALARVVAPGVSALAAPLLAWAAAAIARGAPPDERAPTPLRAAAVVGLLAAAQPALVRQGGQVMAYGAAHAALALALALTVRVALRPTLGAAAGVGLAVGLGWSARSDALATGAGLFAACVLAALVRSDARAGARVGAPPSAHAGARAGAGAVRRALGVGLGLLLGLAAGMAPYGVAMRLHAGEWRLSLKKRLDDVVRVPPVEGPAIDLAPPGPDRPLSLDALVRLELHGGDLAEALDTTSTRPPAGQALLFAGRKVLSAAHPLLLALALLFLGVRPRRGEPRWPIGVQAAWCLPLLAWWAVHTLLKANVGYTSDVHTSAAGVLVALPAGGALLRAGRRLSGVGGRSTPWRGRARDATKLLVAATLVVLVPKALAPQRAPYAVEREVGRRLREVAGPGPLALSGHDGRVVAHYAGAAWVDLPADAAPREALRALRSRGVRLLVFVLRRRGPAGARSALDEALRAAGAAPLPEGTRSAASGEVRYDWALYQIPERDP